MVHLIPSRDNYNAKQMAELMFEEVYKHHGIPRSIVSDRDVLFTSTFWERLHELIGTQLRMSSAYHPQTDGSTERANRTVTQMLRQCINEKQTDWVSKLPAIEFAINSARSESTGFSPFFINSGMMPRAMIWDNATKDEYPSIRNFALQKKLAIMSAHDSILVARVKQTRDANRKRQPAPFEENDLVYVSTKNITFPKKLARKLIPKYIGPYKIVKDFGNYSYRIDLPANMKQRGVHDSFHASLLRIHAPNDDRLFPGRLESQINVEIESEGEWAVGKILSHAGSGENATFEVEWKAGDTTWLPYDQISHLQAIVTYLELLGVSHISSLKAGNGKVPEIDPQIFVGYISPYTDSDFSYINPPSFRHFLSHPSNSNNSSTTYHFSTTTMTRHRKSNVSHPSAVKPHPNFWRAGQRVIVQDTFASRMFSIDVAELQHCLEIDALSRTNAKLALEQAQLSLVYESVARSFNAVANRHQFAIIDAPTAEVCVQGEPVTLTDLGIDPKTIQNGSDDPNAFTRDEIDAANQIFRQSATYHMRRKNISIAEREKKKARAQTSQTVARLQNGAAAGPSAKVRYIGNQSRSSHIIPLDSDASDTMSSASFSRNGSRPPSVLGFSCDPIKDIIANAVAAHTQLPASVNHTTQLPASVGHTTQITPFIQPVITDAELDQLLNDSSMDLDHNNSDLFPEADTNAFLVEEIDPAADEAIPSETASFDQL